MDFTGGCSEVFELRGKQPEDLFTVMLKGYKRRSLTGCSIKPDPNVHEAKTEMGLVMGHAYTISKVEKTTCKMWCAKLRSQYISMLSKMQLYNKQTDKCDNST